MKRILLYTLLFIGIISCSPNINSDDTDPVIENLEIVNLDSINKIQYYVGVNAQFSANFLDNQELGSYKFDIHFAGDGHRHTHSDVEQPTFTASKWGFTKNGDLDGTEKKVTFSNKVSEDALSGPYHCVVYTIDEAGNSAPFVQSNFVVANESMPKYTITEPDFNDYKISVGDILNLKGSVYGRNGLSKLAYTIRSIDEENNDVLNGSELLDGTSKTYDINESLQIPADTKLGKYFLILLASDTNGNVGQFLRTLEITN